MSKIKKYTKKDFSKLLIKPSKDANKYSRGVCNIVAGSKKYPGAAILCSQSAQAVGSGYTHLFTEEDIVLNLACVMPACVCDSFDSLKSSFKNKHKNAVSYVVGPGFEPNNKKSYDLLRFVLSNATCPVVVDGGALSYIKNKSIIKLLKKRKSHGYATILTPHFGEADKILKNISDVYDMNYAKRLSEYCFSSVVLKGPDTYICDDNFEYKFTLGGPVLAKAGSGDCLAGIIAGLLCQNKISTFDSCALSVYLHALAGNLAAKNLTEISAGPQDLIKHLPFAIKSLA